MAEENNQPENETLNVFDIQIHERIKHIRPTPIELLRYVNKRLPSAKMDAISQLLKLDASLRREADLLAHPLPFVDPQQETLVERVISSARRFIATLIPAHELQTVLGETTESYEVSDEGWEIPLIKQENDGQFVVQGTLGGPTPAMLADASAQLQIDDKAIDQSLLDGAGNFVLHASHAGVYTLLISLPNIQIEIPNVAIGTPAR